MSLGSGQMDKVLSSYKRKVNNNEDTDADTSGNKSKKEQGASINPIHAGNQPSDTDEFSSGFPAGSSFIDG
ncbi:hypothetical protein KPH14_012253 [Odynerus spinipes]|uniref:Uncharacterized protein n=1 Tax=Odynerus spinipes TaxID=1348599 RepID=A0AAD9REQ4_9HYME|nr:hypothetical protein KPH14_012253 [Odynerus spinipes]